MTTHFVKRAIFMKKSLKFLILSLGFLFPSQQGFTNETQAVDIELSYKSKSRSKFKSRKRSKKRSKKKLRKRKLSTKLNKKNKFYGGILLGGHYHLVQLYQNTPGVELSPANISLGYNPYIGFYLFPFLRFEGHFIHRIPLISSQNYAASTGGTGTFSMSLSSMQATFDMIAELNIPKTPVDLYLGGGAGLGIFSIAEWRELWEKPEDTTERIVYGETQIGLTVKGSLGLGINLSKNFIIDLRSDISFLNKIKTKSEAESSEGKAEMKELPLSGTVIPIDLRAGIRYVF